MVAELADYAMVEVLLEEDRFVLYRARDTRNVQVLLKVTREGATPDQLSALSSDFLAARRCAVPAIPRPIRIDTLVAGGTYQVRENVPGLPLRRWLDGRTGPLSQGEAMQIVLSLLRALEPLHARGFVHCEVHPRTLLYDEPSRTMYFADCAWTSGYGAASRRKSLQLTPYLAPEQALDGAETVDARADLYAVGVIGYELAAGKLPPEDGLPPSVPAAVHRPFAGVLGRLLGRNPENRYATAASAARDLARCLDEWRGIVPATQEHQPEATAADGMRFPEELLGRHAERAALSDALAEAGNGRASLAVLTGVGGSGKSTVLADLKRAAQAANAVVLVGGWGLFDRDIPFRGLFPLCEELVEWLSTLPEAERQECIARLKAALGDGCGVVTDAFPVLEAVLGIHPRPAPSGTIERQNRLTYCFTTLLAALGSAERPVVVLLEDLHWADGASLFMVERLPGQDGAHHLLTVATVRTGHDGADDDFVTRLQATCVERGQTVRVFSVPPFDLSDTEAFLASALSMPSAKTGTLARLLTDMSLGNPLALRELLAEVTTQGLLSFDRDSQRWTWRTEAIRQSKIPEDVAQIFASRISSLPPASLELLQAAACLGGRFDAAALAELLGQPKPEVESALDSFADAGFVVPRVPSVTGERKHAVFEFRHERIQSATYATTPRDVQHRFHSTRGAILLGEYERGATPEVLFEALSHLNRGHSLCGEKGDARLAELNFKGAMLAKEATAYDTAAQLLLNVDAQLPGGVWNARPDLAFEHALLRAECEHLCKRTAAAAEVYAELLGRVSTREQRIAILMARTQMLTNVGRFAETVADGIASLELLGLKLPASPTRAQVVVPTLRMLALHRRLPADEAAVTLTELDATTRQIMACLAELWGPAFWVSENLTGLVVFAMVRLSLERGNTAASSIAYCSYGVFLATAMKRDRLGQQVCRLGVRVAEKAGDPVYIGRSRFMYESFFGPYDRPLQEAPTRFREIASGLLRAGDYSYAGAAANMFLYYVAVAGTPLADFPAHVRDIVGIARQTDLSRTLLTVEVLERWIGILEGRESYGPPKFADDLTSETGRASENERGVFHLFEISLLYFLENYRAADPHIAFMPGNRMLGGYFAGYYAFFSALVLAKQQPGGGRGWLRKFRRLQRTVVRESHDSPRNYLHKALLLRAIEAEHLGRTDDAERLFEQAMADAREQGFLPNAAIAAELLAEHHEKRGNDEAAERALRSARLWYHQWGCLTKVGAIDRRLPKSIAGEGPPSDAQEDAEVAWPTQAAGVLEAARALSGETDPERLAERLISSILDHTNATRVVLLTRVGDALTLACERRAGSSYATTTSGGPRDLPDAVINYVDRLGRALRLRADKNHELFGRDPYMTAHAGAALLCVPLMSMKQKMGVLFLEKEGPGSLRQSDLVTAEILAAQAAATLRNAREYSERLAALQNQMHPHFLFNALTGIAELTVTSPARAEQAVVGLATLYRNILATSRQRAIPIRQELDLVEAYLTLEKLRFGERLRYRLHLEGDVARALVPPLVLQPLVENSVNHGIALRTEGGTVTVAVSVANARVHIRVSDDGAGWNEGGSGRGTGLGLKSIRSRLELFFGSEVELSIDKTRSVQVDLFFPERTDRSPL